MQDNEKKPALRFKGFTDPWEQRKLDEAFDFTVPNNTLSRAELNQESGSVRNVHYGDVLIKYGSVLDAQNDELPFITGRSKDDFKGALLQNGDIIIADTAEDETTGKVCEIVNIQDLDKMLQYENLIQAFSRTNRLFGDDKQFGTIKYYRRPHTMEKNIADAVKEYSGDKPFGLFVDKLDKNMEKLNDLYAEIKDLFVSAGIEEFSQIPADMAERKKFADLFQSFNENLEAAKVQGFEWDKPIVIVNEDTDEKTELHADFDERAFKVLALRYKELFTPNPDGGENDPDDDVPYAVNSYLTTIDTADIDTDYMNSRFEKYLKIFYQEGAEAEAIHQAETELHKTFATLSQEEQKCANIFLHDIQSGAVVPQPGKTLREYIAEYIAQKQNDQIHKVAEVFGLDEKKLRAFMRANITEANINEFGRFDDLKATVDKAKAKAYFEAIEGTKLIPPKVPVKYDKLLREFIVSGGFDLKMPKES